MVVVLVGWKMTTTTTTTCRQKTHLMSALVVVLVVVPVKVVAVMMRIASIGVGVVVGVAKPVMKERVTVVVPAGVARVMCREKERTSKVHRFSEIDCTRFHFVVVAAVAAVAVVAVVAAAVAAVAAVPSTVVGCRWSGQCWLWRGGPRYRKGVVLWLVQ